MYIYIFIIIAVIRRALTVQQNLSWWHEHNKTYNLYHILQAANILFPRLASNNAAYNWDDAVLKLIKYLGNSWPPKGKNLSVDLCFALALFNRGV